MSTLIELLPRENYVPVLGQSRKITLYESDLAFRDLTWSLFLKCIGFPVFFKMTRIYAFVHNKEILKVREQTDQLVTTLACLCYANKFFIVFVSFFYIKFCIFKNIDRMCSSLTVFSLGFRHVSVGL